MAAPVHPWILTGPWYRWARPGVPATGRGTRPEIQKYAGFEFAKQFVREPQRSLKWKEEDYFHRTVANTKALRATLRVVLRAADIDELNPLGQAICKENFDETIETRLSQAMAIVDKTSSMSIFQQATFIRCNFLCFSAADRNRIVAALVLPDSTEYIAAVPHRRRWLLEQISIRSTCPTSPGAWLREKTAIRKLYRPAHARNYLVVTELSCDRPGLPRVDRSEVAEAGFVIRRVRARASDPQVELAATAALQAIAVARERVAYLERNARGRIRSASGLVLQERLERPIVAKQRELLEQWSRGQLQLDELAASGAIELVSEAWIPDPDDPLHGRWRPLSAAEQTPRLSLGGEAVETMFPLIPDPRVPDHTGARRTLYFGVIVTHARAAEPDGALRFDERHIYEIRCFVRRQPSKPGCPGELVWSEPTIGYRLAHEVDPEGTANLPLSISVPSFQDIKAFAENVTTRGMRIVQPPGSTMPLIGTFPDAKAGSSGIGQICFIAILLLFLIALFLVLVFLPILVFMFQLWFLLGLKFCIPPSLSFDIGIAAKLKAELDVQFDVGAEFQASAELLGMIPPGQTFETWVDDQLRQVYDGELLEGLLAAPLATRAQRLVDLRTDFRDSIDPELAAELRLDEWGPPVPDTADGEAMSPPLPTGGELEYYPVIDPREVFK